MTFSPHPWSAKPAHHKAAVGGKEYSCIPLLDAAGVPTALVLADNPYEALEKATGVCSAVNAMPAVNALAHALADFLRAANEGALPNPAKESLAVVERACLAVIDSMRGSHGILFERKVVKG